MRFLIFGDVVGRMGRRALAAALPAIRRELQPDVVLANAENLAHGLGMTERTFQEVMDAGVTLLTGGNHVWDKPEGVELLRRPDPLVIRPANYPAGAPGMGWKTISVDGKNVLVVNLLGRVMMRDLVDNPFRTFDDILSTHGTNASIVIVDYHAEITSEKNAFGWYADGRTSVIYGTHTHIPTADQRILPKGTAFVTDVGMTGGRDTVLGVDPAAAIPQHVTGIGKRFTWPETGVAWIHGIVADVDPETGRATHIERIYREVTIT
ncbi:TIGR00282 family metallophosphoesterase [Candidatus Uhrbacteria bacterium]|nr:TIGR00282 family metallophosphoesterase [Candidatus Uhrbacteria bacterium]